VQPPFWRDVRIEMRRASDYIEFIRVRTILIPVGFFFCRPNRMIVRVQNHHTERISSARLAHRHEKPAGACL